MKHKSNIRVVDLFCGAGGLAKGFEDAGYTIAAGLDFSPAAVETFKSNFPHAFSKRTDLTQPLDEETLSAVVGANVVVGGPSCQGFSTSGGLSREGGRNSNDSRNLLFENYLDLVKTIDPEWVVFENVPGLLLYGQGKVALEIVERFKEIGYAMAPMILLAADYGVPQLRRRLIFIGNRTGHDIPFPMATHGDQDLWKNFNLPFAHLSRVNRNAETLGHVGFDDACSDLANNEGNYSAAPSTPFQARMRNGVATPAHHIINTPSPLDAVAASHLEPGQNWSDIPLDKLPPRFAKLKKYDATSILRRLRGDKPAYTITTKFNDGSTGAFIHPTQARTLTAQEAARIQSFPDDFKFMGNPGHVRQQIGNAVPPLLAQAIAEGIMPSIVKDVLGLDMVPMRSTFVVSRDIAAADIVRLKNPSSKPRKVKAAA